MVCFSHKGSTQQASAKMLLILMWLFVLADPLNSDEASSTSRASSSTQVLITSTKATEVPTSHPILESASTKDPLTSNLTSTNPIDERHSSTAEAFKPRPSTTESFISSPSSSEIPTPLTVLDLASKTSKSPTGEMHLTTGKDLTSDSTTQTSTMDILSVSKSLATDAEQSTRIPVEGKTSNEMQLSTEVVFTAKSSSTTESLLSSTSSSEVPRLHGNSFYESTFSTSPTEPETSTMDILSVSKSLAADSKQSRSILVELITSDETHLSTEEVFTSEPSTTELFVSSPSSSALPTLFDDLDSERTFSSYPTESETSTMDILLTSESSSTDFELSTSILVELTTSEETHLSTEEVFTSEPSTTESFISSPSPSEFHTLLDDLDTESPFSTNPTESETSTMDILSTSESSSTDFELSTSILVELTTSEETHLSTEEVFTSEPSTTESFISSPSPSEFHTLLNDLESESQFSTNPTESETSTIDILSTSESSSTDFELSTSILVELTTSEETHLSTEDVFTSEPSTTELFVSSPSPSEFPAENRISESPTETGTFTMEISPTENSATDAEPRTSSPSSSEDPTDTFTSDVAESITSVTHSTTALVTAAVATTIISAITTATTETAAATTDIKTSVSGCPTMELNKPTIVCLSVLFPLLFGHWN